MSDTKHTAKDPDFALVGLDRVLVWVSVTDGEPGRPAGLVRLRTSSPDGLLLTAEQAVALGDHLRAVGGARPGPVGRRVTLADDDSPCPVAGTVTAVGAVDDDGSALTVTVDWDHGPSPSLEFMDQLAPARSAGRLS